MHYKEIPTISVVMGVRYLRQDLSLLEQSITSILTQTYNNFEFLICQEGSSVQACQLLEAFAAKDNRIRLIDGAGATSLAQKLNRCIHAAQGEYIARQDDDDRSHPNRLEWQMKYLLSHPELSFIGSQVEFFQDGAVVGTSCFPELPSVRDFLFTQPYIHPTLLFHKEALNAVEGYYEAHRCDGCEDYDLLLRLYAAEYRGANLPKVCFSYTVSSKGTSNRTLKMRCHEVATRFVLFQRLGLLPGSLPYVIKPLLVGLLPATVIKMVKTFRKNSIARGGKRSD